MLMREVLEPNASALFVTLLEYKVMCGYYSLISYEV